MRTLIKFTLIVLVNLLLSVDSFSQIYILNEDFSSAVETTPPKDWKNITLKGAATDRWRFDNNTGRRADFPIIGTFAMFDSEKNSGDSIAEKIILESPFLDCSFSSSILLYFDHVFVGGRGGKGTLEVFNGSTWSNYISFTASTNGVNSEVFDMSQLMGRKTNAKLRFTWEGDSSFYWIVDNIKVFAPLVRDANLRAIDAPKMPFSAGVKPVKVTLLNEGFDPLTSATIRWTINDIPQPNYRWTGNLKTAEEQIDIQIGTYNFTPGSISNVKVWVESPNGLADLNKLNDTSTALLAPALCGTYTLGGSSPNFKNFNEAAFVLNLAGVVCPVVIKVRNGSYDEQIKLYEIPGSSAVNTVTFEGANNDSSLAELHYTESNPVNDFTVRLIGTDYINFRKLGIRRSNGGGNLFIQNGASNISVENCLLCHVVSPNTSCDSVLTFRNNNMQGFDLNLQNPDTGPKAGKITIENNFVNTMYITNTINARIQNNRNSADSQSYAGPLTINNSRNLLINQNRFNAIYMTLDTGITVTNNRTSWNFCCDPRGILSDRCSDAMIRNNNIRIDGACRTRGIELLGSSNIEVNSNEISMGNGDCEFAIATFITAGSRKLFIRNNIIKLLGTGDMRGVYADSGDSIFIKNNEIAALNPGNKGRGFDLYNIQRLLEVDSNTVKDFQQRGIYANIPVGAIWKFRHNTISKIGEMGIQLEGSGGELNGNRITAMRAGAGIVLNAGEALVVNNYIQSEGFGISRGISLRSGATGSRILFNNVNITGTDVVNGRALEILDGSNYTIKNNIFANNGGGYAAFLNADISGSDIDYNNYFSSKRRIAFYRNKNYDTLRVFSVLTGKDANSKAINPFYSSTINLSPNHILLNSAGVAIPGITTDIDRVTRGATPDIGAKEFNLCANDAGVNEFWGLSNPLSVGSQPVKVVLQNQGTNTLSSATIQWEVNGVAQAPFSWTGSLGLQQNTVITIGNYNFISGSTFKLKAWAVNPNGNQDCKRFNDSCRIFDLSTPLCGTYTIGGINPDFSSFYDASVALNNAGVVCPVVFKVRNGSYNEQIKLFEIPGSSAVNTVTFEGLNNDSSLAELHYKDTNQTNDFTLMLTGTDHISFRKMGIRRTNGTDNIFIQNGASHISLENCLLGNVVSPNTSCDSVLTFRNNNFQGFDMNLQNPETGPKAGRITLENNFIDSVLITNAREVRLLNNRQNRSAESYAGILTINQSRNITLNNNLFKEINMILDTVITMTNNKTKWDTCCDRRGVFLERCSRGNIRNNTVRNTGYPNLRGIELASSTEMELTSNNISVGNGNNGFAIGVFINGNSNKISLFNNIINMLGEGDQRGVYADWGDTMYFRGNQINALNAANTGKGFELYNVFNILEVDSNFIKDFQQRGILARTPLGAKWKFRNNMISGIGEAGIFIEGNGGEYTRNRITAMKAGAGIVVNGTDALIANNYIQSEGLGIAKGISIRGEAARNKILFNNVNITGTDYVNGRALELSGGTNNVIMNNIFANNGGGYAAYIDADISSHDFNYNNYFSTLRRIAYYRNRNYDTLSLFSAATDKDGNSKSVNPFYSSKTNLLPNHTLLNGTGIAFAEVTTDIDRTIRTTSTDIGAKEFSLCANDAGVNEFWDISNPLQAGRRTVKVVLQNQGINTLTSANIQWKVNGELQTPFSWTGALGVQQNTVITLGNYTFSAGSEFELTAWAENPNKTKDCNNFNDTARLSDLGTSLCGLYTIGGNNPDFQTFSDAAIVLNNAGVSCPVVFRVRNGIYNEQVKLFEIPGASSRNTITFESESGNNNLVELHYKSDNPSNDFTFKLSGTDYLTFDNISILRSNGRGNLLIQDGAHHITVKNCKLGDVSSLNTTTDSVLVFRNNEIRSKLSLLQPLNKKSSSVILEGNRVDTVQIDNTRDMLIKNNNFNFIDMVGVSNVIVDGNKGNAAVDSFNIYQVGVYNSKNIQVKNNSFYLLECNDDTLLNAIQNTTPNFPHNWGVIMRNCRRTQILENNIRNSYGIYSLGGDSVYVKKNIIKNIYNDRGYGLQFDRTDKCIEVDSNQIYNTKEYGILAVSDKNINWKIRNNIIQNVRDWGIFITGFENVGSGGEFSGNRILRLNGGIGIFANLNNTLISNNYIQAEGPGIAKGISLQPFGSGAKILYNSVNITGTDILNAIPLEILGGNNYIIKNNIFANNGGGYAAFVKALFPIKELDYNCYYTPANNFAFLNGINYSSVTAWGAAIGGDANSKRLNPFYESLTSLLPYQRRLNGAGISVGGILLDIDGELRNQQAPDVGAQEFMVDFGVTRLESPTNECTHTTQEEVSVYLRQFGDIPFQNIRIAYQVNGGTIYYDTIPGSIENDITYTFKKRQDLSLAGIYSFKVWLVDNQDDNPNNDTLFIVRLNKPAPVVNFTFTPKCANEVIPFVGIATIREGFIDRYEWDFGDNNTGLGSNPNHIYDLANTYDVRMRAYSDQGCYSEITKKVILNPTPDAKFTVTDVCDRNVVVINNETTMAGGTDSITYKWDYGNGKSGNVSNHLYNAPGTYRIKLTATSKNGCTDTIAKNVVVKVVPKVSFKIDSVYYTNAPLLDLIGSPVGGVFSGRGVVNNAFSAALAGPGKFTITYSYTDPENGCGDAVTKEVTVIAVPKIIIQPSSITECEGSEVSLTVSATGTSIKYQWYQNDQPVKGADSSTLLVKNLDSSKSGIYFVKVFNVADTVLSRTISVTVNKATRATNRIALCDGASYQLPDGKTVKEAGTYTSIILNVNNCDSTITTIIKLGNKNASIQDITSCRSYTWNNVVYNKSGTYKQTLINQSGCDSVVTLNLTITPPLLYYRDNDGDGYGTLSDSVRECSLPQGYSTVAGDCNDKNPDVNPGVVEICDGIDNNCNGQIDETFADTDKDGVRDCVDSDDDNDGIPDGSDCAPQDATKWRNGTFYIDVDSDGFGTGDLLTVCYGNGTPKGYSTKTGDCDDQNIAVKPGAVEICDNVDNNCNGQIDEGLKFPVPIVFFITQPYADKISGQLFVTEPVTQGYSYSINGVNYQTEPVFENIRPDKYTLYVRNQTGCIGRDSFVISSTGFGGIYNPSSSCAQFITGKGKRIEQLCYKVKDGLVSNVVPGMVAYKTKLIAPSASFCVDIEQYAAVTGYKLLEIHKDNQITLRNSDCNKAAAGSATTIGNGRICIDNAAPGGQYILFAKYDPKSVEGSVYNPDKPINRYGFVSKINGKVIPGSQTSIMLDPDCQPGDNNNNRNNFRAFLNTNPTTDAFILNVVSDQEEPVKVRITDIVGRVMETFEMEPESILRKGDYLSPGVYMFEFTQGENRVVIKGQKLRP